MRSESRLVAMTCDTAHCNLALSATLSTLIGDTDRAVKHHSVSDDRKDGNKFLLRTLTLPSRGRRGAESRVVINIYMSHQLTSPHSIILPLSSPGRDTAASAENLTFCKRII